MSEPAVYRHFPSKQALLIEVARRSGAQMEAQLGAALAAHRKPIEKVRASCRAYVRWAHDNPHMFRLFSSRIPSQERTGPVTPFPPEHYFEVMGRAIPIDDPRLADAFRTRWALSHGLATFVVERVFVLVRSDDESLHYADRAIDMFVEMLEARWPQ